MAEPGPRYSFDPLERRGVLLGLQPVQLLTVAVSAVAAFVADRLLARHGGHAIAGLLLLGGATSALWTRYGRPVSAWSVEAVSWFARRAGGPVLDDRPLQGIATRGSRESHLAAPVVGRRHRTTSPPGVSLALLDSEPGRPIGVVVDRRHGRWVATLPVKGRSFSLLDPADQARKLDGWRVALNSLGRPGTAVRRVQWIERSSPDGSGDLVSATQSMSTIGYAEGAASSYRDLIGRAAPAQLHETYVCVAVDGPPDIASAQGRRSEQVLRREVRLLEGQLRNADLAPAQPFDAHLLTRSISATYELDRPGEQRSGTSSTRGGAGSWPWPVAEDEHWSHVRSGRYYHATYWIADWPRVDVNPDFLTPLLVCEGRRTVSLVMAPVAPDRAAREVRSARAADAADEQLRSRAGFLPSARRGRETEGVMRREAELAEGHAEFRFSGYVTVHALGPDSLELACAEAEHAAQTAHLELRRLFGRQREALGWTLPMARGLR